MGVKSKERNKIKLDQPKCLKTSNEPNVLKLRIKMKKEKKKQQHTVILQLTWQSEEVSTAHVHSVFCATPFNDFTDLEAFLQSEYLFIFNEKQLANRFE